MNYELLNGLTLAYMGDAIWSLYVREYFINQGITKSYMLQKQTIKYVSAKAQAKIFFAMCDENLISEAEHVIFKRGRNGKVNNVPKNTDLKTYQTSTGFEALIGYLYLSGNNERVEEIFNYAIALIEES